MSKSLTLYGSIMSFVWQTEMRFNDLRNLSTFVWAIVGLLASGSIHLSLWSLYRNSRAKAAGIERQFSRWLHNDKIETDKIYQHLARLAFIDWTERSVELALTHGHSRPSSQKTSCLTKIYRKLKFQWYNELSCKDFVQLCARQ